MEIWSLDVKIADGDRSIVMTILNPLNKLNIEWMVLFQFKPVKSILLSQQVFYCLSSG